MLRCEDMLMYVCMIEHEGMRAKAFWQIAKIFRGSSCYRMRSRDAYDQDFRDNGNIGSILITKHSSEALGVASDLPEDFQLLRKPSEDGQ